MASSVFVISQNYCGFLELHCISTGPILVDVSHLEVWISTSVYHLEDLQYYIDAFQLMLYVVNLYQPYQLMQPGVSPGTVASVAKIFSDQVYKLHQCNILLYLIVQRVKVAVASRTDLKLLLYQTAII